jgi:hypothetical protein
MDALGISGFGMDVLTDVLTDVFPPPARRLRAAAKAAVPLIYKNNL